MRTSTDDRVKDRTAGGPAAQMRRWIRRLGRVVNLAHSEGVEIVVVVRIWDPMEKKEMLQFVYPSSPVNARGMLATANDALAMAANRTSLGAGIDATEEDDGG